ncbi:unnamed protein product [Effrenium voratum]|uniref:Serine/threonine specific protein phosphatases domain-containing protein n=1 Tax=Effrenium voratum TaxID=2562239 RepID=A0AA36IFI6_9DINO|nr:unnamed protein product [Effrenium voratum]
MAAFIAPARTLRPTARPSWAGAAPQVRSARLHADVSTYRAPLALGVAAALLKRNVRGRQRIPRRSVETPSYSTPKDAKEAMIFAKKLAEAFATGDASLPLEDTIGLLKDSIKFLHSEPTLVRIEVPAGGHLNVVGDVHGQLWDFLSIFEENGWPSEENPYLFNGDFVDRGSYSVEIMLVLIAFKLALPRHFFLSRGNHEDESMNHSYGFTGEVLTKYDTDLQVFQIFQLLFVCLPLSHVVNSEVFITHGGLPREEASLEEIASLDRLKDPQEMDEKESMLFTDLLWADPNSGTGLGGSQRGGSLATFGSDITQRFLQSNDLSLVIRSHECKDNGFEWAHDKRCLTVFSAPNYCDEVGNQGAVIRLRAQDSPGMDVEVRQFGEAKKPKNYVGCMAYASNTPGLIRKAMEKALG